MARYTYLILGATLLFANFLGVNNLYASARAQGAFTAQSACEAFVSKNKRTNPDDARVQPGKRYVIFEVNKPDAPTWYRIRLDGARPNERWINADCGAADVRLSKPPASVRGDSRGVCRTTGHADSFKLALSWHPAFCEIRPKKTECQTTHPSAYQAQNFTLHGLWPNKTDCGINYNFCGAVTNKPDEFCDYPKLDLTPEVRNVLNEVMPSAAADTCLQRHEWFKHGTCQTRWTVDEYFERAIDLTRQFNTSPIGDFMARNIGKRIGEREFYQQIDNAFGPNAHKRFHVRCKKGNLVDLYINLPARLKGDENLADLIRDAQPDFHSTCGGRFRIDPIGVTQPD